MFVEKMLGTLCLLKVILFMCFVFQALQGSGPGGRVVAQDVSVATPTPVTAPTPAFAPGGCLTPKKAQQLIIYILLWNPKSLNIHSVLAYQIVIMYETWCCTFFVIDV